VVAERAAFWRPLAEDTERRMTIEVAGGRMPVRVSREDLATCTDILLENVFAHTPDGAGCAVRLSHREPGGAWLIVADDGPGFPQADPTERGRSGIGSTGLGLDIARRIAESSGGILIIGRSASGGGEVSVGFGPPIGVAAGDSAAAGRPAELGPCRHAEITGSHRDHLVFLDKEP
jgi:signal transduction histidine kinase